MTWLILLIKTLMIFTKTLYFNFLSLHPRANITQIKKNWALSILKDLDINLKITHQCITNSKLVLVGNHVSFLDIIVLMAAHPEVVFLSKQEVSKWPIIGSGAKRVGTIFVNRGSIKSKAQARLQIEKILASPKSTVHLAGFPSGTTSLTENIQWKKGLFEIAKSTQTLVQPFYISYKPLRECAYIDDDTLFTKLMLLLKYKNKTAQLTWGTPQIIQDTQIDIKQIQSWITQQDVEAK